MKTIQSYYAIYITSFTLRSYKDREEICGCQGSRRGSESERSSHSYMSSMRGPCDGTVLSRLWWWSHQTTHVITLHRKPTCRHKHDRKTLKTAKIWIELMDCIRVHFWTVELREMLALGKLGEGSTGTFCIVSYNCVCIYCSLKNKEFWKSED